jgi:hypothetical protein
VCHDGAGGDVVSTRALLAVSGVLATLLGIPAGMGLVALCGLESTNILGALPFLIIGIGLVSSFYQHL